MNDVHPCRPYRSLAAALLIGWALLLPRATVAQAPAPGAAKWTHKAHAMELDLPSGWRALAEIPRGALVRFVGPGGEDDCPITVAIKQAALERPDDVRGISEFLGDSYQQVEAARRGRFAVSDVNDNVGVGHYPAGYIYYRFDDRWIPPLGRIERLRPKVAPGPKRPWVMGQAFVQVGLATVVVFQLDVDADRFEAVRPDFEGLFKSLKLDVGELDRRRRKLAIRFHKWRQQLEEDVWHKVAVGDQWYRIVEEAKDVGFMHVRQKGDTELSLPGIRVTIESHVTDGKRSADSISEFFLSDNDELETWSIRMTERSLRPQQRHGPPADLVLPLFDRQRRPRRDADGNPRIVRLPGVRLEPDATSWADTGVRTGDRIKVTRESSAGPAGDYEWGRPEVYLPQVHVYLLGQLGARAPWEEMMGFYAYFPSVGKIRFRTERLEQHEDGRYQVSSVPTANTPATITDYDGTGRLKSQAIPGGRSLLPTSKAQIMAMWSKRQPAGSLRGR